MSDIERLTRNAKMTLRIADAEGWSAGDNTRALANDALKIAGVCSDLLAVAEKIAEWSQTPDTEEGGEFSYFVEELIPELFAAIAAAKGE